MQWRKVGAVGHDCTVEKVLAALCYIAAECLALSRRLLLLQQFCVVLVLQCLLLTQSAGAYLRAASAVLQHQLHGELAGSPHGRIHRGCGVAHIITRYSHGMESVWQNCTVNRYVDGVHAELRDWLDDIDRNADHRITWSELQVTHTPFGITIVVFTGRSRWSLTSMWHGSRTPISAPKCSIL